MFNISDVRQLANWAGQVRADENGKNCIMLQAVAQLAGVESAHLISLLNTQKFIDYIRVERRRSQEMSEHISKVIPGNPLARDVDIETKLASIEINTKTLVECEDSVIILSYYAEDCLNYKALESLMFFTNMGVGLPAPTKEEVEKRYAGLCKAKGRIPKQSAKKPNKVKGSTEAQIQAKLLSTIEGAKAEVSTPYGRIDILSSTQIIEIKRADKWKDAIGQIQAYSTAYPHHKKVIYLFGKTDRKADIIYACSLMDIEVVFEPLPSTQS